MATPTLETATRDAAPLVVMGSRRAKPAFASAGYRRHVARALTATATVIVGVTFLRTVVLWGLERQPIPEWRFTALASTVETLPWLMLALAIFYTALHAGESTSLLAFRLLGLCLILLGVIGAGIGAGVIAEYGALLQEIDPEAARLFRSTAVKAVGTCILHLVVSVPIGVLGLRRPIVT